MFIISCFDYLLSVNKNDFRIPDCMLRYCECCKKVIKLGDRFNLATNSIQGADIYGNNEHLNEIKKHSAEEPLHPEPALRDLRNRRSAEEPPQPELALRDLRNRRSAEEPPQPELALRDVRNRRSAEEPPQPELALRDVRNRRSAEEPPQPELALRDLRNRRSAEEPPQPELALRDVRNRRSAEERPQPELALRDVRKRRSAEEPLHPELAFRDVRKRRSLHDSSDKLTLRAHDRRNKRTLLHMFREKFRGLMNVNNDNFRDLIDIRKKRMVDDPVHREDQVQKERQYKSKRMVDDPVHREDQVEKERKNRRKRMVDDSVRTDDQDKEERVGGSDDTEASTLPPHIHEEMNKMKMLKRSIVEEDVPDPLTGGVDTLDITEAGGLARRQKRSIVEENTPLPPFDDTESSDITKSGDLGMRQERSAASDKDSAEEREGYFIPAQLHEIDTTNSRYVSVNSREVDVDFVHGNEGRIQGNVDRKDEETESFEANLEALRRSRRGSDVSPKSDKFFRVLSGNRNQVLPDETMPLNFDEDVYTFIESEKPEVDMGPTYRYDSNVAEEKISTDVGPDYTVYDKMTENNVDIDFESKSTATEDSSVITADQVLPNHFVVETMEPQGDLYETPYVREVVSVNQPDDLIKTVETPGEHQDQPLTVTVEEAVHTPIPSVVETLEPQGDAYETPIVKEAISVEPSDDLLKTVETPGEHQDQPLTVVVEEAVHTPIPSVVETLEPQGDAYETPIVNEAISVERSDDLLKTVESLGEHQDQPLTVVVEEDVHIPTPSVIETMEPQGDANETPIVKEVDSVKQPDDLTKTVETPGEHQDQPLTVVVREDVDKPINSVVETMEPQGDSNEKPIVREVVSIKPSDELTKTVETPGEHQDQPLTVVVRENVDKPLNSVVETLERQVDSYEKPIVREVVSVKPSDELTKTVETPGEQQDQPSTVVVEKDIHKPVHSVVHAVEDRGDLYDTPIIKEFAYIKEHPSVEEYNPLDSTESKNDHKQENPTVIVDEPGHEEKGSSNGIITDPIRRPNVDIIPDSSAVTAVDTPNQPLPDMAVESKHIRVNDKKMRFDESGTEVAASSTSALETTVPVTETTVPVTHTTLLVTDTTHPVTYTTLLVTDTTHPVTETTVPVTDTTHPVTDTTTHPVSETTVSATTNEPVSLPYELPVHLPMPEVKPDDTVLTPENLLDERLGGLPTIKSTSVPVESTSTTSVPSEETVATETATTQLPTTETTTQVSENDNSGLKKRLKHLIPIMTILTKHVLGTTEEDKDNKDNIDPRDSRGPHVFPDVVPLNTSPPKIELDRIVPPIGFEEVPDSKRHLFPSIFGPTFTDHPVVSISDVLTDKLEGDYEDTSVLGGNKIVPQNKNRGGYDKNHGGYDDILIDCDDDYGNGYGKGHGGHDKNRGGYGKIRGGYDKNRGGYDKHRGEYDKHHGGYDDHHDRDYDDDHHGGYDHHDGYDCDDDNNSGYDDHHGHDYDVDNHSGYDDHHDWNDDFGGYNKNRGGYDKNRGGYDKNRGGYNKNRGGYDKNRGGYNKNHGGYDQNVPDCDNEVDIYDKNHGGYNKNRGGYNKHRGGYNKDRGGYNKGSNGNGIYIDDCDEDQDFGGYNKNRGGYIKNGGGYKNRGGYSKNRGGYDGRVDIYDEYVKDWVDDYSGYKKNVGGYKKNGGGYKKNGGGYSKFGGGKMKNRDGYIQRQGYVSKFDDPYVEYEAGHHGGPGDIHFRPHAGNYHLGLGKRSVDESEKRDTDVRRAKIPEIGLLNPPSSITEPKTLTPDVLIPKFEPPAPLAPELRKRPHIGDESNPGAVRDPESLPNKFLKPLQRPDWDAHPFKPKSQIPRVKLPIFEEDPIDNIRPDLDKGAYWHKLEIPIFGFEHEAQIQPIHKLKYILFPKPLNSKKDESFTRMKLGPWSMRFGLDL